MSISQFDLDLKVLDLLEEFEDKIDNLSAIPLTGKVMLDREEIQEIIREINILLPEEYQHVKWIKSQKNQIIDDAQNTADAIMANAQQEEMRIIESAKNEESRMLSEVEDHLRHRVEEHEIVRLATEKAREIVEEAEQQAYELKQNAYEYTEELLVKAKRNLAGILNTIDTNISEMSQYKNDDY